MRRFLNLGGKTLHVDLQQGGSARPIVFINSLGTDLRIWEAVMARLRLDQYFANILLVKPCTRSAFLQPGH